MVVNLAAERGGNGDLSAVDRKVVSDNDVTTIGYTDFSSRMAAQSSGRDGMMSMTWRTTSSSSAQTISSTLSRNKIPIPLSPTCPSSRSGASQVFVCKCGYATGNSGIEDPVLFKDNTRMFYGDAKRSVSALLPMLH